MLQIEIRFNGILIDYVNVENISPTGLPDDLGWCRYRVVCRGRKREVSHRPNHGALTLAALALTALVKRKVKL